MSNKDELLQKARGYAFLLLKFRLRSEKEIYRRLKQKKFTEEVISETVSFLKEKGFIDDEVFAMAWIESRLKKPLGLKRIRQELNLKGIAREVIDTQICQIKAIYSEPEAITKLAKARLSKLKGAEPITAKRRLYSYLLRRGFSPEAITDILNQLCKHTP